MRSFIENTDVDLLQSWDLVSKIDDNFIKELLRSGKITNDIYFLKKAGKSLSLLWPYFLISEEPKKATLRTEPFIVKAEADSWVIWDFENYAITSVGEDYGRCVTSRGKLFNTIKKLIIAANKRKWKRVLLEGDYRGINYAKELCDEAGIECFFKKEETATPILKRERLIGF